MLALRRTYDDEVFRLIEESGDAIQQSATVLRDLIQDYPDNAALAQTLVACEHHGDRLTHDLIHRLSAERIRVPFPAGDGYVLATALDDVIDHTEQAGSLLGLYGIEAPLEQAVEFAQVLVDATEQLSRALRGLRDNSNLSTYLEEIHRLENEGDRLLRDAMVALFAAGTDPMLVIRWKDILQSLEDAVDACETVAHLLEGIALKQRRR